MVPQNKLQNKAGRYYFKNTMELAEGELFISPFDLNIEHGKVEQPVKPMIRFGTPVFDRQGNKSGVVLLNYLGADLISILKRGDVGSYSQLLLLNKEGYWLKGSNPNKEWGFMYEDKQEVTFANKFSDTWERILSSESGQIDFKGGVIVFNTIYPLTEATVSSLRTDSVKPSEKRADLHTNKQYFWKIAHHIPPEQFGYFSKNYTVSLLWLFVTISFVVAVISWIYATIVMRRRSSVVELKESEARFKALHDASFGGVIIHD